MSRTRLNNVLRLAQGLALCAGLVAAAGCAGKGTSQATNASGGIGYVRMKDLIVKHPLYPQLAKYDDDIAALQLKSVGGTAVASNGANIQREELALQKELDAAAARTRELLKEKQNEYQTREDQAIKAALAAANGPAPPGAGAIASQIQSTSNQQAREVAQQAQQNLNVYRQETIAQDQAAVDALRKSLGERADRTYRAKAEELREKESAYSLQLASADAPQRLALRTKLSNLPLDDASRKDITDQLQALDRKEADGVAAMRNRDQATLSALQSQLHAQTTTEFTKDVASIHERTNAKISERTTQTREHLIGQLGGPVPGGGAAPATAPTLSADMKAKLQALHQQYQGEFQRDADQTVKAFYKTKDDLTRRFAEVHGVDAGAQDDVRRQIDSLQKQRDTLYGEMVAQIEREVKLVAQRRSVALVFGDIITPAAGGVDLTDDAARDLESLHE